MKDSQENITKLLGELRNGNSEAHNQLMPIVYENLKKIARNKLRYERSDHTLNTSALVHEAYMKMIGNENLQWQDRAHFFALAAQNMRWILTSYAVSKNAQKRGGGADHVSFEDFDYAISDEQAEELVDLNEALDRLNEFNPRGRQIVEYKYFAGLKHEEIAEVMQISVMTVRRSWTAAKLWLQKEMTKGVEGLSI